MQVRHKYKIIGSRATVHRCIKKTHCVKFIQILIKSGEFWCFLFQVVVHALKGAAVMVFIAHSYMRQMNKNYIALL